MGVNRTICEKISLPKKVTFGTYEVSVECWSERCWSIHRHCMITDKGWIAKMVHERVKHILMLIWAVRRGMAVFSLLCKGARCVTHLSDRLALIDPNMVGRRCILQEEAGRREKNRSYRENSLEQWFILYVHHVTLLSGGGCSANMKHNEIRSKFRDRHVLSQQRMSYRPHYDLKLFQQEI